MGTATVAVLAFMILAPGLQSEGVVPPARDDVTYLRGRGVKIPINVLQRSRKAA